jgi:hypothetical protein
VTPSAVAALTQQTTDEVLDLVLRQGRVATIVDSPPGAGKTRLVESVAAVAARFGLRVAIVAPRAEQTYDIVRRLLSGFPGLPVQLLQSANREIPLDLATNGNLPTPAPNPLALRPGPGVVAGNAAKFGISVPGFPPRAFDLLICDEAYQLTYKDFAPLAIVARQVLLVGDPGQLPPLVKVDIARFEAARSKVHWPAPRELLRRFPAIPVVRLPASRRLPPDTVDFVQPAFYPDLPFVSAALRSERRLAFAAAGLGTPVDRTLDLLTSGATIVGLLLPPREPGAPPVDAELAALAADIARRILDRGAQWIGERRLTEADLGSSAPHVATNAAVTGQLRRRGITSPALMVDTPEIWQGLQRPIMIVEHPLSGLGRLDAFGLEPGRWCVQLSRHQLACIIVARDGIGDALESHEHNCADRPMGATNAEWLGWRAHQALWTGLASRGRLLRV